MSCVLYKSLSKEFRLLTSSWACKQDAVSEIGHIKPLLVIPREIVITCSMLGLKSAAHKGFQWVVLVRVLLAAFIATILISAKQSLLLINSELMMGDVKRRNGNGPCSGILCPNGNLMAIVWRHTCSLISHAFKTYSGQSKKKMLPHISSNLFLALI